MNEIAFFVNGEPYTQIRDWRRCTDLKFIKHQLEAYSYRFTPTTVGDLITITITHHASGASQRMGEDIP